MTEEQVIEAARLLSERNRLKGLLRYSAPGVFALHAGSQPPMPLTNSEVHPIVAARIAAIDDALNKLGVSPTKGGGET